MRAVRSVFSDERPQVLGRRAPTIRGVIGSARPTLKLLLDNVSAKTDAQFWNTVTQERRKWDEMLDKQSDLRRNKDRIYPQMVARAVSDLARDDATFVLDTGLNTLWSANWIRQTESPRSTMRPWEPRSVNGIQVLTARAK